MMLGWVGLGYVFEEDGLMDVKRKVQNLFLESV